MQVVITDKDSGVTSNALTFSLDGEEKNYVINFNLQNLFPGNFDLISGYSLTLGQLSVFSSSSSPGETPKLEIKSEPYIFYYDCEGEQPFEISLEIDKAVYEQIEQINSSYKYEVSWKKFFKPSVKYTYQKDSENRFIYYVERKKKIVFNSDEIVKATFAKEKNQTLNLITLGDKENFFDVGSSGFELIGLKNENFEEGEFLQIIPLGSQRIFNNDKDYTFSLLVEKEEEFPLDFFIKNSNTGNGTASSSNEIKEDNGLNNPLT
jgi:hypothetical protein